MLKTAHHSLGRSSAARGNACPTIQIMALTPAKHPPN